MVLLTFNIINNSAETLSGNALSGQELGDITVDNTESILRILELHGIRSTFFINVNLVEKFPKLLKKLVSEGHEIALYNDGSPLETVAKVKEDIYQMTERSVKGIRRKSARLSTQELRDLGFVYISDIENSNILFPFRRLRRTTEIFEDLGVSIIPESISPYSQIPYNDFIFQVTPMEFYKNMVTETLKNEEFVMIYLNTWQFTDYKKFNLKVPLYRRPNSGRKMEDRLEEFLAWVDEKEFATSRIKDYIF